MIIIKIINHYNNAFKIKIKPYVAINSLYVSINVMYQYIDYPELLAS